MRSGAARGASRIGSVCVCASAFCWVTFLREDSSGPPSARLARFTDYWGTVVHAFDLRRAHRELCIVATSQVETTPHSAG